MVDDHSRPNELRKESYNLARMEERCPPERHLPAYRKPPATVFSYLHYHDGIEPKRRARRPSTLSMLERKGITRGLAVGISIRAIASTLGRSPSTVSRKVSRNGGSGRYRATEADQAARMRAVRPKTCSLVSNAMLRALVTGKLSENWSPEQISGWLRHTCAK